MVREKLLPAVVGLVAVATATVYFAVWPPNFSLWEANDSESYVDRLQSQRTSECYAAFEELLEGPLSRLQGLLPFLDDPRLTRIKELEWKEVDSWKTLWKVSTTGFSLGEVCRFVVLVKIGRADLFFGSEKVDSAEVIREYEWRVFQEAAEGTPVEHVAPDR